MSRIIHTYEAPDLSALARTIKRELEGRSETPGHVEILNILSRAAGFRNYQHLKASRAAEIRLATVPEPQPEVDFRRVEIAARCFDVKDVLLRWPGKTNLQALCLWKLVLLSRRSGHDRTPGQRSAEAPPRLRRSRAHSPRDGQSEASVTYRRLPQLPPRRTPPAARCAGADPGLVREPHGRPATNAIRGLLSRQWHCGVNEGCDRVVSRPR